MLFYVVFFLLGLAAQLDGYVVLQLRKQANQSEVDVDALIHKRVTRNTKDIPADHPKESKVPSASRKRNVGDDDSALEADSKVIALGLDTGVAGESKNGIVQAISDAFSDLGVAPYLRTHGKKSKHSDDKGKKPLAVELKSDSILKGLEEFLASPKVKKITHDLARKAAIIYRAIEKEL